MPSVYISSFFKSKDIPDETVIYSAAVYQPKGYQFPKADWTDIRDAGGAWTRPRNYIGSERPLEAYRLALYRLYSDRIEEARRWLLGLGHRDAALLCWCPSDKAARRQLEEFGSFTCHTAVLGEFLTDLGVPVWYDAERLRMSVLTQKGL
jgi:hypothetical protein